ncbi:hypothetical protein PEDI_30160 [Persicobacter diffluens]|uniref:Uncharacterized protein n=1 Tax=Persicobacter diffluens TaxID=981 RepID=A0AAN4W066_9BACT|nr:hypothetical protein PEDI_30160 [Persicobacter diffluens]
MQQAYRVVFLGAVLRYTPAGLALVALWARAEGNENLPCPKELHNSLIPQPGGLPPAWTWTFFFLQQYGGGALQVVK